MHNGNGDVRVNIVSESTNSMDVLSGGESDAGDTLSRRNNNSVSSNLLGTLREGTGELPRRRDVAYFVAKELLMTERTYKRDLELITVSWSARVSQLAGGGCESGRALALACLALGPLALAGGPLLARLERALAATHAPDDNEEPEYKRIAEILYDYLTSTTEAYATYTSRAGGLVGVVESVRRCSEDANRACAAFDASAPLPLACLLLRPLHRLLHLHTLAIELCNGVGNAAARSALGLAASAAARAREELRHVENHAALCQLQRDIAGYDKLLVAEREFIRLGCMYKHSTRGLQQKMLFLFSDVLVLATKSGGAFRALATISLATLNLAKHPLPHSLALTGEDVSLLLSASNEHEYLGWFAALERALAEAHAAGHQVDTELTPYQLEVESGEWAGGAAAGALAHVCWHRATALSRHQLHLAMRTQLSGYLLRKFKKSPGWQKLWVVFAAFTLFFYKSWQDETPLASLPLLGYGVGPPGADDGIDKDFVFKLQFKNHVYFFRADGHYTYNRWTEVLQTAMIPTNHNEC